MTEFRKGDVVRHEGVVLSADGEYVTFEGPNGYTYTFPTAAVTLIDRPTPTLPTEPGTTGTATVRGVEGVRVMRVESTVWPWVSASRVGTEIWHDDDNLADFEPDPPMPEPATDLCECGHPYGNHYGIPGPCGWQNCPCRAYRPVSQDAKPADSGNLCECGHGRRNHTDYPRCDAQPPDSCPCTAYRPATPSTEETR